MGDRWIAFAYINDETDRSKTQQVVGFYECVSIPTKRVAIPPRPQSLAGRSRFAWAIRGRPIGWQPSYPVTVPPINRLLRKNTFAQQTLIRISEAEFRHLRDSVRTLKLDPKRIPLLNRDPQNEQEVVGILLAAHSQLGIEKIDRIRTRFPDLRVKINGRRELVHLEVETYSSSFLLHHHHLQVHGGKLRADDRDERLPVGVVCWYDDDKGAGGKVGKRVHKVYELQDLLQKRAKIRWGR